MVIMHRSDLLPTSPPSRVGIPLGRDTIFAKIPTPRDKICQKTLPYPYPGDFLQKSPHPRDKSATFLVFKVRFLTQKALFINLDGLKFSFFDCGTSILAIWKLLVV